MLEVQHMDGNLDARGKISASFGRPPPFLLSSPLCPTLENHHHTTRRPITAFQQENQWPDEYINGRRW
jgi:hypothetical protein